MHWVFYTLDGAAVLSALFNHHQTIGTVFLERLAISVGWNWNGTKNKRWNDYGTEQNGKKLGGERNKKLMVERLWNGTKN